MVDEFVDAADWISRTGFEPANWEDKLIKWEHADTAICFSDSRIVTEFMSCIAGTDDEGNRVHLVNEDAIRQYDVDELQSHNCQNTAFDRIEVTAAGEPCPGPCFG